MDYENMIERQLDDIDLYDLERIMDEAAQQSQGIFDSMSAEDIISSMLSGEPIFDADAIVNNIFDLLLVEIRTGLLLGAEIISVCIVIGLLNNFSDSFGNNAASKLGNVVCSCIIITLCMTSFSSTYDTCLDTLNVMTYTMQILLPILIPLLISMGGFSSGSILNPVILGAVTGFNTILQKIVLPVLFLSSVFILINSLTEKPYLKRLAVLLRRVSVFCTGLAVTIFTGVTAVQGIVTKSADGLLVNTARYSIDNFVPIVGKFAADSVDMVLSCAALIKNGIGLAGMIIIICFLTGPIINLLAVAAVYKITAVVSEPICSKEIAVTLNEMGSSVITMTVILGLSALMFLIFITVIISIGGGTLWK